MTTLILLTIAGIWVLISGIILVSVCMLSSRLSRAEEARDLANYCHDEPQGVAIREKVEASTSAPAQMW